MDNLPINWCRTFNSILRTLFISQWFWESRARCQFRFEVPPIFERLDFRNRMKETYLTFLGTNLSPPKLVEKKSFWIGILLIEEILLTSWGWYFYPIICRVLKNPKWCRSFFHQQYVKGPFWAFFCKSISWTQRFLAWFVCFALPTFAAKSQPSPWDLTADTVELPGVFFRGCKKRREKFWAFNRRQSPSLLEASKGPGSSTWSNRFPPPFPGHNAGVTLNTPWYEKP